jgi:hypothetical protein
VGSTLDNPGNLNSGAPAVCSRFASRSRDEASICNCECGRISFDIRRGIRPTSRKILTGVKHRTHRLFPAPVSPCTFGPSLSKTGTRSVLVKAVVIREQIAVVLSEQSRRSRKCPVQIGSSVGVCQRDCVSTSCYLLANAATPLPVAVPCDNEWVTSRSES